MPLIAVVDRRRIARSCVYAEGSSSWSGRGRRFVVVVLFLSPLSSSGSCWCRAVVVVVVVPSRRRRGVSLRRRRRRVYLMLRLGDRRPRSPRRHHCLPAHKAA